MFFSPEKTSFLDLKNFFRLFRPKNFIKSTQNLEETFFNLQIDEKNNIFLDFIAKNCPSNEQYELKEVTCEQAVRVSA